MALWGTGANVQCTGYFPGYYSTRDLIFGAEGSTWTSSNGNGELKSDCYLNGSLPASSPAQFLGYNGELLKQTILKHEAIFRDQIHDLHRLYQKQRELMDELKRNELYKHNLRLETSWSNSTLSHVSSKNDQKICCSPSLPWLTGQSSVLMAESIQFPLSSVRENNRQLCLAPVPTEGYAKDPELSESKCRKVGKKILDLELPADEYIDSEGESLEDEGVCKVPRVSAYTLSGISQLVCNNNDKPSLGSNGANSNGYVDLNALFKLEGKATANSDDLVGYTCLRNIPSHDLSSSTKLGSYNLSNDVIVNPKKRQDIDACSNDPPLEQEKKHGRLFYTNNAGRNGTEQLSVSSEIFNKKPEHPCFLDQINKGAWSGRKFSSGESSVGAQGSTIDGLVGPSSALRTCSPYQLVSMGDITSSGISPAVLWERHTGDLGQSPIAVQAFPSFGTSAPLGQSSISLMGMTGFPGDELYHCKSIKSGPNLDRSNFLLSSFCSGSKTSDPPLINTNDLNSPDDHRASHELMKYAKRSEDVGTPKNMNLNIMPSGYSDIGALQSNQVTDKEDKFQDLERGLPFLKEKRALKGKPTEESKNSTHIEPVLSQPYNLGGLHGFELKKVGDSDLNSELGHHINGQPRTSSDLHSSHASPSKICKNWSENRKAGKIEEDGVSDVKVPCNDITELAEQAPPGEHIMKNELEKKHEGLAGHIDLNSCMNEDESMPIDIDLQAPVSPENKECSPPRGESDENQLEMPYRLVGQDDPEVQEEQVRIAAGSLLSISASMAYNVHQMTSRPPSESFASDSLHWFAGIVSSVMDYRENGVKVDFSCNTDDLEELLPAGFDYFEAMTLKLNETKVVDCCCKSGGQNEEEGGSTSSTQPRKGRTNRGRRRKDFQSEILPSLASLSRYEVTEDLQTIGGLMEAAGTHLETGSLRSSGRNVLARGRRRSFTSASNISDLLLKQLTDNTEPGIEKRSLISWGKINRKRRGQRYPARYPQFILSQAHN